MTGPVFVDSNVLVYARDRTDEEKHTRALEWMAALWESESGRLSYQVLHEDGQAIDGLTVISPFTHDPRDVLGQ